MLYSHINIIVPNRITTTANANRVVAIMFVIRDYSHDSRRVETNFWKIYFIYYLIRIPSTKSRILRKFIVLKTFFNVQNNVLRKNFFDVHNNYAYKALVVKAKVAAKFASIIKFRMLRKFLNKIFIRR